MTNFMVVKTRLHRLTFLKACLAPFRALLAFFRLSFLKAWLALLRALLALFKALLKAFN